MSMGDDIGPTGRGAPQPGWEAARLKVKQLECETQKMSPQWFAGNAGVIVAACLFLMTALFLGGTLERILQHSADTQRTQDALRQVASLQEALGDVSATEREFVATRDRTLLGMRNSAKRSTHDSMDSLITQLNGDSTVARKLREINNTFAKREHLFDQIAAMQNVAPVQPGAAKWLQLVRLSNSQLSDLRDHLLDNLRRNQGSITANLRFTIWLVLIVGITAPVCGLVGVYLLHRERDSQRAMELQMELMHVQRLAIMGETSAMLAHEINQPLTAATNYVSVLRRHLEAGTIDKAQGITERINQQIQRAGSILRKLRSFIEKREAEHTIESPEVLIDDAITLLGTIDSSVALDTRIGPSLPRVLVDRVQLQQVLVNLMRNAIEAMQQSPRRELVLSVASPDGKTVEVSLADTGPGLPQHVADRLFQPFVSTKQSGMGVGLSICRSIIARHNGRIWAEPNAGGGTIFRFTLPAVEELAAA